MMGESIKKTKFRIAHLSDVHIKDHRRKEYEEIFKKLFSLIEKNNIDVIAICGDIFHDKTRASANNYSDVESFLNRLSKISSVI